MILKKKKFIWCITAALLLAVLPPVLDARADKADRPVIQWRVMDWPPVYILDGPFKHKGAGDELIRLISSRMPAFHHERVVMSNARFNVEIQKGRHILNATGLPAEHLQNSFPNSILIGHQVIIREKAVELLESIQSVSLVSLLSDSRFSAAVSPNRYGPLLDPLIHPFLSKNWVSRTPNYIDVIRMLYAGRVDYIIEYPGVIRYYEAVHDIKKSTRNIPIKEVISYKPFYEGFVVGPKTQWGVKVMGQINGILIDIRNQPEYRLAILRWADPEYHEQMNWYMDKLFKKPEQ